MGAFEILAGDSGYTYEDDKVFFVRCERKKSALILELCRAAGADYYISGAMGKDYLDVNQFAMEGVQVEFQNYQHPEYPQLHGEFIPYMGIADFAMNALDYSVI